MKATDMLWSISVCGEFSRLFWRYLELEMFGGLGLGMVGWMEAQRESRGLVTVEGAVQVVALAACAKPRDLGS